jgi:signal transduction histidine kinase/tetratricopeptide (TPR) repeat protein
MKRTFPKRTRILLLFIGGIGLPSLLLGYLAFRGVKNDQALIEKDRIEEHRRIANRIVQTTDQSLASVERAFRDVLAGKDGENVPDLVPALQAFKKKYPLVEEIFNFHGPSKTDFPCAPLLYRTQTEPAVAGGLVSGPAQSRSLEQGERLEFQNNDPGQALRLYQQALRGASGSQARGEALIRIARVQRKSGRPGEALQTYRMISQSYGQTRTGTGLPLGLVARLEIGPLARDLNSPSEALEAMLDLYRELLNGRWLLDKGEFEFAIQRTKEAIRGMLSPESPPEKAAAWLDAFRAFKDRERLERARTERRLLFQGEVPRALRLKGFVSQEGLSQESIRFNLEAGQERYLVSLIPQTEGKPGDGEIWGLILEARELLDSILPDELKPVLSEGRTGWALKDPDGGILAESSPPSTGMLTIETSFKEGFPDWTLQLYQPNVRLPKALLTSRRGVFFAMFLLIAGILAFGFVLTLRSITREIELSRMKSDFVSTVSHEFKSPLTSIRQIAEMLETGRVPSENRRRRYYQLLLEQSERLSLLTDNVLSFARMEEGKREFEFDEVDAAGLLEEVVSPIRDRVRHDGFKIELAVAEGLPPIRADRAALSQVISNLIDNAIKYSGASRKVEIGAFGTESQAVLTVKDYGLGIPKAELPRVFDRFFRGGDELTRTVKGSGLGLTLVKQIVEAHGGTVGVESEHGKGSRFTLRLPYFQDKGSKSCPES